MNNVKRGRGRPRLGKKPGNTPFVGIRLPAELTAKIDTWAKENKIDNRSTAIRRLLEHGLADRRQKDK